MDKGVIYVMSTVVPGLIKIGKTMTTQFENRMRYLENNGYSNVTGLKRQFAIEISDYDAKEVLLQTIFEKSRVGDTELFSLDLHIAEQLLSSFEGRVIYPKEKTKVQFFESAVEAEKQIQEEENKKQGNQTKNITEDNMPNLSNEEVVHNNVPDGYYRFEKQKRSDNDKMVRATAYVQDGYWTIKAGSILGIIEDKGVTEAARKDRNRMKLDENGRLIEDVTLTNRTPSHAGAVVMNQSINGWTDWHNMQGQAIEIYRKKK